MFGYSLTLAVWFVATRLLGILPAQSFYAAAFYGLFVHVAEDLTIEAIPTPRWLVFRLFRVPAKNVLGLAVAIPISRALLAHDASDALTVGLSLLAFICVQKVSPAIAFHLGFEKWLHAWPALEQSQVQVDVLKADPDLHRRPPK